MNTEPFQLDVKNIGHLRLLTAVFKELKLVECIDEMLAKTSRNVKVSNGQAVMAMIMQGLGYSIALILQKDLATLKPLKIRYPYSGSYWMI